MDISLLTSFMGIFVAVLLRTLLPYVDKLREAEEKDEALSAWNPRYTWTCISALITGFISAMLLLPTFAIPLTVSGQFSIFAIAFGYGWGVNDVYNKVLIDWR